MNKAKKKIKTSIDSWYKTALGKSLFKLELNGLSKILPKLFGYYIAQAGGTTKAKTILQNSKINNRIIINPSKKLKSIDSGIFCDLASLPLAPKSIDVVVLFHALEQTKDPLKVLGEIHQALIDGGHLIVIGFNPLSLWGLTKTFRNLEHSIWKGKWLAPKKLSRMLLEIGFGVGEYQTLYFRPPLKNPKKMAVLEGLGTVLWPNCGASYIYVAEKTSPVLTPIKKLQSPIEIPELANRAIKPTTRSIQ